MHMYESARPFAPAIVVDGMNIVEAANEHALEQGLAGMGRDVPPAFGGPTFGILVADGHADAACRGIAQLEVGTGNARSQRHEEGKCDEPAGGATKSGGATKRRRKRRGHVGSEHRRFKARNHD